MMATTRKIGLILIILISLSIFNTVSGISYYETTGSNDFKIELAQEFWNGDANNNKIDDLGEIVEASKKLHYRAI